MTARAEKTLLREGGSARQHVGGVAVRLDVAMTHRPGVRAVERCLVRHTAVHAIYRYILFLRGATTTVK